MCYLRLLGAALVAAIVLGAMGAATASAEDGMFLKSALKNGFTISGGKGTLSMLNTLSILTCTGVSGSGSVGGNDAETFSGTMTFTGCGIQSLGDAAGTILLKFKGLLCTYTEGSVLKVGAYIENEAAVHIEGITLLLFLAKSSQIAEVTPTRTAAKSFTWTFASPSNGDQKVVSCSDLGTTLTPGIKVVENESGETMGALSMSLAITAEESTTVDG